MKNIQHTFFIRKGQWGLWMNTEGSIDLHEVSKKTDIQLSQGIFLRFELSNSYSELITREIIRGMQWVLSVNPMQLEHHVIVLRTIEFEWTNFQLEGVFYGAATWLSKALGYAVPEFEFLFDKEQNKYIFPNMEYLFGIG